MFMKTDRQDGLAKVTGRYVYCMDLTVPGMLHGAVVRSTRPHAKIARLSTDRALALPGVRALVTSSDLPDIRLPGSVRDQPLLARGRVRYVGEPIALVAADRPEIAEEAARLIEVSYEDLPVLSDPEAAIQPGAPLVHENWAMYEAHEGLVREGNVCCHASLVKDDVVQGFADSDHIFEEVFSTNIVHQGHLEPRAALATLGPDGRVTIYTNSQIPYSVRTIVAAALDVPESGVNVVPAGVGGGFGSKLYSHLEPLAAHLARATGRPVRLTMPIEEELVAGSPRHACKLYLKTGVKADGTLIAREAKVILDAGAYAGPSPEIASLILLVLCGPYRTANVRFDAFAVYTNKTNFGAYRAPGGPQPVFAIESHLDTIARGLGLDPLEIRMRNIVTEGDEAVNGQILYDVGIRECLQKAAEAIDWNTPAGPNRGKGLACGWWLTAGGSSGCLAKLEADGKITVTVGAPEIGTGAIMGGVPRVIADAMGVDTEAVRVQVGDTSTSPWDDGSHGSRTLYNVGRATEAAAVDLILQIKEIAAQALEASVEDLELSDGSVVVRGVPSRKISLAEIAKESIERRGGLLGRGVSFFESPTYDKSRTTSCLIPAFSRPSFHCHAAEVEIDPSTGEITVVRYVAAHDVGFALDPVLVEGQIHGGVMQGIGMALMEEVIYRNGQVVNNDWTDYKLPTIADAPDIRAILVQRAASPNVQAIKGVGEPPVMSPPAALANAVYDATGVRIRSLPITAEKVLLALSELRSHGLPRTSEPP